MNNSPFAYAPPEPGVDPSRPLIYMWEIFRDNAVVGRYIGKANGGSKRPTCHYRRNVEKLLRGEPYRSGKDYRRVHYALASAHENGERIVLSYLCNVEDHQDIFEVENELIRTYRCDDHASGGLNGRGARLESSVSLRNRPDTAVMAKAEAELAREDHFDLEDFLEIASELSDGRYTVHAGRGRYVVRRGTDRLLRAKQSGPRGKVFIKLVQSWKQQRDTAEIPWDGSVDQIRSLIEHEIRRLMSVTTHR